MEATNYDVIVVGASNAGGMAACAAAEKGAKVLLIDKQGSAGYLYRLSIAGIDTKAQKKAGIKVDKTKLINFLSAFTQDNIDQRLLWKWADNSAETVDWLEDNVLKPHNCHLFAEKDASYETLINTSFPTEHDVASADGKDVFYGQWVIDKAVELGVTTKFNTKLEKLITDDSGKVIGIAAGDRRTGAMTEYMARKGVILCTGGYGSNEDLMKKWDPLALKKNVYSDSPRDDGSGIIAAMEIGAAKDEEPAEIVFNRGAVPVGTNAKEYYIKGFKDVGYFWMGSYPLLKVNLNGERYFNESEPYEFDTNSSAKQPGYLEAAIWDEDTLDNLAQFHTEGCARLGWPGFYNTEENRDEIASRLKEGFIQKADTIEELADKLDMPKDNLVKSVTRYNQMCAQKKDTDFGKEAFRLVPVTKGPFYGAILGGRLLATLDGLRINTNMEVITEEGKAIPHLYAAGNCSGGFFWGSYPDHVPGLTCSHAQTFGRLAGQNAAEN
ncbi:FAD-binding protein [Lactobacillus sp. ESL0785]|uniref:FAD-dependent oxidoreductase n=1 Tax=Lactobacillus sp. ESL0785 TaxID=2983232 RepID=UPI0023F65E9A|nr:FAD-binding protein [Lactobacillus sp. ESL0785]WEV71060.1 FAD-binding protein [Lactobacillus sp. ESL0785]